MVAGSWSLTITDTNGTDHTPAIISPRGETFPKRIPAANGRPTLEVAVPPERDSDGDPKWFAAKFEEADASVSYDGTEQPFSKVVAVEDRPGQDVTILTIEGGSELDEPVSKSVDVQRTHLVAGDVIETTSYTPDVPLPSTTRDDNVLVQDRAEDDITFDLLDTPPRDDEPIQITASNHLTLDQTLFLESTNTSLSAVGDSVSRTFTLGYDIPAERVGAAVLLPSTTDVVGLELKVGGVVVGTVAPGEDIGSKTWEQRTDRDVRLTAGTYDLVVEVTAATDAADRSLTSVTPDAIAVYDDQYNYDFDTSLTTGPELYPESITVDFDPAFVSRAVKGLSLRTFWVDNEAAVNRIRNGVRDVVTGSDGESTTSTDFDFPGPIAGAGVEIGRYGTDGSSVHELTGFRLEADLDTIPLVVDAEFEGRVADVLTELAQTARGDFVWTYDTDANGNGTIRFVRVGGRTSTQSDVEDYSLSKSVQRQLDEVTVRGGRVTISGEGWTASHGTAVTLNRDNLVEESETVRSADRGEPYDRGSNQDYTIDYDAGEITALSGGRIDDGERVLITYQYQPRSTVEVDSPSAPIRSETVDILPLKSDRACRLAAGEILDTASTPTYVAEATLRGNTTYSAVESLTAARLPTDADLETVDIEATERGARVRLEGRESIGRIVADIRDRIQSVARHAR